MAKRFYFLSVLLILCISSFAQWGYRASITDGWGGSGYVGGGFKLKLGGYLDAVYDVKIHKNLYLQPGAGLFFINADNVFSGVGYTRVFGIETPLNLSLRPAISEDFGIYIDFGFVGRMRLLSANSEKLYKGSELLTFAVPFNIGLGVQIEKKYMIGLAYQGQPLSKNTPEADWYGTFGITFGYKFK